MVKTQYAFEKKDLPSVKDLKNDKELGKIVEEQLKEIPSHVSVNRSDEFQGWMS